MAMKPVPKAILIALAVGGLTFGDIKFLPKDEPAPVVPVVEAIVVAPPTEAQVQAAQAPSETVAPQERPLDTEAPRPNVSTGDAGLSAVLGAGR